MLVFIIPLKSAKISDSWKQVSKLFERTIRSLCNQTSSEFRVVTVCHEKPEIEYEHPNITYIKVDFTPPTWEVEIEQGYTSKDTDKQKKIFIGLTYASQFNPTHIMFVDADDCVSKNLAEFVKQNPNSNGWIFDKGYEYVDNNKSIFLRQKGFNYRCGTSSIISYDLISPDENVKVDEINNRWLYHGKSIENTLQKKGYSWQLLPFPGSVYITDNGSNMVNQKHIQLKRANSVSERLGIYLRIVGKKLLSQSLTNSIREEFGLYDVKNSQIANVKQLIEK